MSLKDTLARLTQGDHSVEVEYSMSEPVDLTVLIPERTEGFVTGLTEELKVLAEETFPEALEEALEAREGEQVDVKYSVRNFTATSGDVTVQYNYFLLNEVYSVTFYPDGQVRAKFVGYH